MISALNRRQWIKASGAALVTAALSSQIRPLRAQHEKERTATRAKLVRISANENPFGPSQAAVMAMMQAMEKACRYPFEEAQELMQLIAAKEGCAPENIVLGVG